MDDAGANQVAKIISLKEIHNKELIELKGQLSQVIDKRIHLADQLEQSKKSNVTLKDKYQALRDENKGKKSYLISLRIPLLLISLL